MIRQKLYTFSPLLKQTLWGGERLARFKGLPDAPASVGESWEISSLPGSVSVVANGYRAGTPLSEVLEAERDALVGRGCYAAYGNEFPLLVKFIDARLDLSVQVHPGEEVARLRHGCSGKSEMWYVVDAEPGARLLDGFNCPMTPEKLDGHVKNCTLEQVMHSVEVHPGDLFYLPAGRVHSIGAGCFVCEVQQASDITYRLYDYGRVDSEGRPRQLHIAEAMEVVDFTPTTRIERPVVTDNEPSPLVSTPFFDTALYRLTEPMTCDYSELDSFVLLMCTRGACRVTAGDEEVMLPQGGTLLVAAATNLVQLEPQGPAELMEVHV